jgi:serine phosphatase RsbU (regulator of sigma subunit)
MPIGYTFFDVSTFCEQTIQLFPDDKLILFTDGIVDQFGGLNQKKFGRKMLREWLLKATEESTPHLFSKLVHHFECWKGKEEQTDDCTILVLEPHFAINPVHEKHAVDQIELIRVSSK